MISLHLHFALFITFLTLLKLLDLEDIVPKVSAGSWFQSWMILFTKEYFPISLLLSASNSPIVIDPAQIAWSL
jgi:hypothetical protein